MGENKVCSSCGNTIPAEAVFCPNCGSVQSQPEESAQASQNIETSQKPVEDVAQENKQPDPDLNEVKPEPVQPVRQAADQQPQQRQAQPVQPNYSSQAAPQMQRPQQAYPQTYQQPQQPIQGYQQPYYGQPQPPAEPAKPKKKFPWVFTIVWAVMLAFVGIWGYSYFMLSDYQVPEITTDTVRILTFAVSVILLIYTLNIRLLTKKFKVIPTILLIIFLLASFFMYASFEMIEGDWLHDAISPVTDALFQIQ